MRVMDRLTAAEITLIADRIGDLLLKQMMEQITTLLNKRAAALEGRSVKAFCARWGISRGMFYAIPDEMPATMLVGGRRFNVREAHRAQPRSADRQPDHNDSAKHPKLRRGERTAS
jgi:hypothetical protein